MVDLGGGTEALEVAQNEEMRIHHRHEVAIDVVWTHAEVERTGRTANVSLGGMFIKTADSPPFHSTVRLKFRIPALRQDTNVEAHVRWVEASGFGVQFIGLRAIEVWGLNQLFKLPTA
jgi:c-di-GMP-binding flagellar brake protein YcgR